MHIIVVDCCLLDAEVDRLITCRFSCVVIDLGNLLLEHLDDSVFGLNFLGNISQSQIYHRYVVLDILADFHWRLMA